MAKLVLIPKSGLLYECIMLRRNKRKNKKPKQQKNRGERMTDEKISFICTRSAELRKGKSIIELSQSDAMRMAWKELQTKKMRC